MQVMSNGRVRRTEKEWRELLSRWEKCRLSAREFCRKEEVKAVSFRRWQQRLCGPSARSEFVPVVAVPPAIPSVSSWAVEVTLPDGSKLRFQG